MTTSPPDQSAPPRQPGLPARGRTSLPDDLDPEYLDLEDLDLTGAELDLPEARSLTIARSRLAGCRLDVDPDVPVEVVDSVLTDVDLTGRRVEGLDRVRLERCRLGGADLGDARVRDAVFQDCVLDLSSWLGARLERVAVDGGRIDGVDLGGASLTDVAIADVVLADVRLEGVRAERVDLTGADVSPVLDPSTLRGCTISPQQAVALAVRSARALGVQVLSGPR